MDFVGTLVFINGIITAVLHNTDNFNEIVYMLFISADGYLTPLHSKGLQELSAANHYTNIFKNNIKSGYVIACAVRQMLRHLKVRPATLQPSTLLHQAFNNIYGYETAVTFVPNASSSKGLVSDIAAYNYIAIYSLLHAQLQHLYQCWSRVLVFTLAANTSLALTMELDGLCDCIERHFVDNAVHLPSAPPHHYRHERACTLVRTRLVFDYAALQVLQQTHHLLLRGSEHEPEPIAA
jgi:hypothetical protein